MGPRYRGLPWQLSCKESMCNPGDVGNAGDKDSIPGQEDALEKETATHSSILAWDIPWTEKPGGLYSPWDCKESDTTEVT